jgi:hypothetical protein
MANAHLATDLASFTARVQKSKNRLVAIPAEVQRKIGLKRRKDNHIALVSLRRHDGGHWNHQYVKLTIDNEFMVSTGLTGIAPGDALDVKLHRLIPDVAELPAEKPRRFGAGAMLQFIEEHPGPGWRTDGSVRVDEYLRARIREGR